MNVSRCRESFVLFALVAVCGCGSGGGGRSSGGASIAAQTSGTSPAATRGPSSTSATSSSSTFSRAGSSATAVAVPGATSGTATPGVSTTTGTSTGPTRTGTGTGTRTGTRTGSGTGTTTTTSSTHFGPLITLTSPTRASYQTQNLLKVAGTVTDPNGVSYFTIQQNPVAVGAGGAFTQIVPLDPGLTTVVIDAANARGERSKLSFSVVEGTFLADTQPVPNALAVRLNQRVFDVVAQVAASKIGGPMLAQQIMARNPLYQNSASLFGATIASIEINCVSASFGQPSIKITPQAGSVAAHVDIPQVDVVANASGKLAGIPYSITGHVTADDAIVDVVLTTSIVNGQIVTQAQSATVTLQNFAWGINGIPSFFTNLATSAVRNLIQDEVAKQVKTIVPDEVNKAIAQFSQPITQTIIGTTATFSFAPTLASWDPLGFNGLVDANVQIAPVAGYTPLSAPGSLVTSGAPPQNGGPTPAFLISANEDLLNRTGHAAWKAGVTNLAIDQTVAAKMGLPAWLPFDAFLIQTFFPSLAGKMSPTDPIAIVITPKLPAVFRAEPKPDTFEAALGDFTVEIWDIAPGAQKLILSFAMHARVRATASLGAGNTLKLGVSNRPFIDASLVDSPLDPALDPNGLVSLVQFVMPPIIQIFGQAWSGYPLPVYNGITPTNVDFDADGAKKTFVTVKGDL